MSLLSVRDLRVTFPSEAGTVQAVRGVDFNLERGRTLCLVGESGSGKSATASAVIGLLADGAGVSGSVRLDGDELVGRSDTQMSSIRGRRIGMVFQDPLSALTPMFTVGQQVADAVRVHQGVSKATARARAVELLDLVGIREPARRAAAFPHEFSGGMRQRVVIALAIANDPDLIIADEPTTALDVTVQAQILDVLRTAQQETDAGLLLITHDLGVVAGAADDVAVMYSGRIVERAPVDDLFARPRMPYTIGLLGAVPSATDRGRLVAIPGTPPQLVTEPSGCPFADRCPIVTEACRTGEPELRVVSSKHEAACIRADAVAAGDVDVDGAYRSVPDSVIAAPVSRPVTGGPDAVLAVRGLIKTYPVTTGGLLRRIAGHSRAVRGIDLDLGAAQTHALVGESGSGKSSTVLELMRLQPPESGTIEVLGTPIDHHLDADGRRRLRSRMQLVMQDPAGAVDPRSTIFDVLAEPLRAAGRDRADTERRVVELLELVGLPPNSADRFPAAFSGGQRQRITIARALALEPAVVILDEPVSALDMSVQADVLNLLVALQRRLGVAFLLIAHDLAVVRHLSDQVSVMYLGTIVETGPAAAVFDDPRHPYTRALLSASPVPDPALERSRERTILVDEPDGSDDDGGCVFRSRCPLFRTLSPDAQERCRLAQPLAATRSVPGDSDEPAEQHRAACHVTVP